MEKTNIFKCKPPKVHFTIRDRVPYNKLLTNLACSSRTVEYWPSVVFVRTSLRSVRTATTSGQYSPVRPLRSVSKRLLLQNYKATTLRADLHGTIFVACDKLTAGLRHDLRLPQRFKTCFKMLRHSSDVHTNRKSCRKLVACDKNRTV